MYGKLNPDVVTMDITMPNMDGLASLKTIKQTNPGARVIMISALGQKDKVKESLISGAMDFVIKPFVPERVIEVVTRVANK
jgi:two-component system, chemotaxis family, chemotaxis protein CheY